MSRTLTSEQSLCVDVCMPFNGQFVEFVCTKMVNAGRLFDAAMAIDEYGVALLFFLDGDSATVKFVQVRGSDEFMVCLADEDGVMS